MFLVVGTDVLVEALAASWIEISNEIDQSQADGVEALAASWIEIRTCITVTNTDSVEALAASWIEMKRLS